jgi:hypothetical protein
VADCCCQRSRTLCCFTKRAIRKTLPQLLKNIRVNIPITLSDTGSPTKKLGSVSINSEGSKFSKPV